MRLGNYVTTLLPNSFTESLYKTPEVTERHRHRYEVNNDYIDQIESSGLKFVGYSMLDNGSKLAEIAELPGHPYYVGCQYHPEFKTRYETPHPLFNGLISAITNKASRICL